MKRILYIIAVCLLPASLSGQMKIDRHMDFTGKNKIILNIQISDSIKVMTWNKNEVYVAGSVNINDNKDNAGYETEFSESGSEIKVKAGFKDDYFKGKKNHCVESEINWVVYIPERADLSLESIDADITITGKTWSAQH